MSKKFLSGSLMIIGIVATVIGFVMLLAAQAGWSQAAGYKVTKLSAYIMIGLGSSLFITALPWMIFFIVKYRTSQNWDAEITAKLHAKQAEQAALKVLHSDEATPPRKKGV